jgi:transcriptional regulator with XRE-family HTH domain
MGANRLTNEKVAALAGVAPKVISAVRNGKENITLTSLKAVAKALNLEVEIRFNPKTEALEEARPAA